MEKSTSIEQPTQIGSTASNFQFRTPAAIQDFTDDPIKQKAMNTLWSNNLDEYVRAVRSF